jgi:hypothetical protein
MKQVKLIAALLLFALGASAQTVTPDPGPYTPMNQKYEYRWIKTSGGLWNIGKFVQVDSAQFSGVTYVPSAASNDSSIKAANTGWVRRLFATASGSAGKWDTAGNAGLTDPRLGTTNNSPFAFVTNNIKRLIMPAAGILSASSDYVFLVKDTLNGELKYTTSAGGTFVPYTGATQDVNLGEFGLQTGNVEFDNTPTNLPNGAGSMYYNDTDGTLDLILKGANVKLQIGQESVIRVVNKTATNINLLEANYQAVRVTGAQGQRLKVDLAQATTDALSAETIGLVTETINNNQEGFITTSGLVRNINTTGSLQSETWADGDIVYLSPTTAGRITNVKPSAPNHLVIIGYVIHAHATQGSIFVKVDNGYELDELHNVKITTPTNNQALIYNDTTDIWENKTISGGGGGSAKAYTPLIVRNDSVYQRFNVLAYGADNTGTTDATTAIQNAINAAYSAGGGTVFFPNGKYLLSSPLVTSGTNIGNPNSQLYLRYDTILGNFGSISIKLLGETPPAPNASALANYAVNRTGVILYSTITGSGTYPSIFGTDGIFTGFANLNLATLTVENINFRVKANISASGPTMSALNLSKMAFVDIKNVVCDIDTSSNLSVYPTAETFGIYMPYVANGAYNPINNTIVTGYKYGYIFSEHTNGDNINAWVCEHAFVFATSPHSQNFGRLAAQWCKYSVSGLVGTIPPSGGVQKTRLNIDQLAVEWEDVNTYNNWFSNRYIVYDSANRITGRLTYNIGIRSGDVDNSKFNALGADSLMSVPLGPTLFTNNASVNRSLSIGGAPYNYKLNIYDTLNSYLSFQNFLSTTASNKGLQIGLSNTSADILLRQNLPIDIYTNNTNRVRVTDDGNVLIGTTTNNSGFKLQSTGAVLAPSLTGSISNGGTLTLTSTSNATKGKLLFGNSAYDEVNNRLGVGINAPTSKLHIGSIAGAGGGINLDLLANSGTAVTSYSSIDFNVPTTGIIGQFLSTASNYNSAGSISLASNSIGLLGYATSGQLGMFAGGSSGFFTVNTGGLASAQERLRITSAGNVGIGTTTPTALLQIKAGTATANTAPLKFTSGTNLTTPEAGAMEFDGTNYFVTSSTTRFTLAKTLVNTATLDFGSTAAGTATDLTITVTGAADGDAVSIGVPNGSTVANGSFTAWVSATNTVTIRFSNSNLVTALDPASGTFRAVVLKY